MIGMRIYGKFLLDPLLWNLATILQNVCRKSMSHQIDFILCYRTAFMNADLLCDRCNRRGCHQNGTNVSKFHMLICPWSHVETLFRERCIFVYADLKSKNDYKHSATKRKKLAYVVWMGFKPGLSKLFWLKNLMFTKGAWNAEREENYLLRICKVYSFDIIQLAAGEKSIAYHIYLVVATFFNRTNV